MFHSRLEAIAGRLEAIASRLEATASASRLEAIASSLEAHGRHSYVFHCPTQSQRCSMTRVYDLQGSFNS